MNLNGYVDEKEIYEAKADWVKANQLRLLKIDNCEHLWKKFSLIFNKASIIRCYDRLENETKNKHSTMLSRTHDLAKLVVL